jgi:hypothetical protein
MLSPGIAMLGLNAWEVFMKKMVGFLVLISMFSTASYAQMTWYPPVGTWSGPAQLNSELINDSLSQVSDPQSKDDGTVNNLASSASLTYSPNRKRTNQNLQNFADKTRAVDPAQAEKMEAFFASTDLIGEIGDVMANFGLSRNNAADAFALYWIATWQAAHGDTSTPSKGAARAVAAQAARGMSQSSEFAAASDAQKQEMAEALMVQAALIEASVEDAGGDAVKLKALGKAVKQGASASGLELDTMTLTEEGFREGGPRKRSDASDVAESEKALAANDAGTDGGGTTNYALIAAAAGAGLGGVFLLGKAMGRNGKL